MKKGEKISNNNYNYSLIKSIGNGGSGVVWKADKNGNNYAIKFLDSENKKKLERFNKELIFCKSNQNKNIIKVIADGEFNGKRYYIMPLFPKTLKDVINEEKDADVLIKYILQLCEAIRFIHELGVIHRDIKPENVLIDGKQLVLADFGIAHFKDSLLTQRSDLLANRNYLAPEQKIKNNANRIETSADIYALGLIINECFTKKNPTGSNFKIIEDNYPSLYELDTLVLNMIKQNHDERFSINEIITELKFINRKIEKNLKKIKENLIEDNYPKIISSGTFNKIVQRASEDLSFAETVLKNKSLEEINKYNRNWHMRIGYTVDSFLLNLYVQERIFNISKHKFNYESNSDYTPLNLLDNDEHKQIVQQLKNILKQYPLKYGYDKRFDLSGKIMKYFISCSEHHCNEILKKMDDTSLQQGIERLLDSPILWIVYLLKVKIQENFDSLTDLNLAEHIKINWDRTKDFKTNEDDNELFDSIYIDEENKINEILLEFKQRWGIIYNKIDSKYYSIKFGNYNQFNEFREYALQLSEPHHIFNGDVLNIVNNYNNIDDIVEIKISTIFEIPDVIAKILGLRSDY